MTTDLPFAVIGATGQQGGAVVDALVAAGAPVRALVRDPTSEKATALEARGVQLARADNDDADSLSDALADVGALFMMTTFAGPEGTDGEIAQGRRIVDAAVSAQVPRVVYSSVGGADRESGIPHFESKRRVEESLTGAIPATFVRPTFFMDNLSSYLATPSEDELVVRLPMPGDVPVQMVAVRDIGVVSAALLLDPGEVDAIEIAGDELSGDQVAEQIGRHLGRPGRYEALPLDALGDDEDRKAMFRWFVETPAYAADLSETRRVVPDAWTFPTWLDRSR